MRVAIGNVGAFDAEILQYARQLGNCAGSGNKMKYELEGASVPERLTEEEMWHNYKAIRNVGKAGIPILGYHFMPNHLSASNSQ